MKKEYKLNKPARKQVKILKNHNFKNINEYFSYIIESYYNGQHDQAVDLYDKLNKINKKNFYFWCKEIKYINVFEYVQYLALYCNRY